MSRALRRLQCSALTWCALLSLPLPALGDLPVHCERHQVAGDWDFVLSPPSSSRPAAGYRVGGGAGFAGESSVLRRCAVCQFWSHGRHSKTLVGFARTTGQGLVVCCCVEGNLLLRARMPLSSISQTAVRHGHVARRPCTIVGNIKRWPESMW